MPLPRFGGAIVMALATTSDIAQGRAASARAGSAGSAAPADPPGTSCAGVGRMRSSPRENQPRRDQHHDAISMPTHVARDATDLYLLLGCLNDLMAIAAYDLGYPEAAEELPRAAGRMPSRSTTAR